METVVIYELARKDGSYETLTLNEGLSSSDLEQIKNELILKLPNIDSEEADEEETLYDIGSIAIESILKSIDMKILRTWIKADTKWTGRGFKCRDVYKEAYLRISINTDINSSIEKSIKDCATAGIAAAAIAMAGTLNIGAGWAAFNAIWLPCIKTKVSADVMNSIKVKMDIRTTKSGWHWCT